MKTCILGRTRRGGRKKREKGCHACLFLLACLEPSRTLLLDRHAPLIHPPTHPSIHPPILSSAPLRALCGCPWTRPPPLSVSPGAIHHKRESLSASLFPFLRSARRPISIHLLLLSPASKTRERAGGMAAPLGGRWLRKKCVSGKSERRREGEREKKKKGMSAFLHRPPGPGYPTSYKHSCIHSSVHPFIHSSIHSFVRSSVCSRCTREPSDQRAAY